MKKQCLKLLFVAVLILTSSLVHAGEQAISDHNFALNVYRCSFSNSDHSKTALVSININEDDINTDLAAAVIDTQINIPSSTVGGTPRNGVFIGHFDEENSTFQSKTDYAAVFIKLGQKARIDVLYRKGLKISLAGTCRTFVYESVGAHN